MTVWPNDVDSSNDGSPLFNVFLSNGWFTYYVCSSNGQLAYYNCSPNQHEVIGNLISMSVDTCPLSQPAGLARGNMPHRVRKGETCIG